jgi:DNA repair exonuclease SbcCD nuclease subunit
MHQGCQGSQAGDYIQDKTALPAEAYADFRVISGHYHTRQDIDTGKGNTFSYIGNPYTLNFAEANDPKKGFQILHEDGVLTFVPTNLRRHAIFNVEQARKPGTWQITGKTPIEDLRQIDIVKVKLQAPREVLNGMSKEKVVKIMPELTGMEFRLELIPVDQNATPQEKRQNLSLSDNLDSIIDSTTNTTDEQKTRVKGLWRELK